MYHHTSPSKGRSAGGDNRDLQRGYVAAGTQQEREEEGRWKTTGRCSYSNAVRHTCSMRRVYHPKCQVTKTKTRLFLQQQDHDHANVPLHFAWNEPNAKHQEGTQQRRRGAATTVERRRFGYAATFPAYARTSHKLRSARQDKAVQQ